MITKGIIKTIEQGGNTCTVRLPLFEMSSKKEVIISAIISAQPGVVNNYKEEDIVLVDFENNKIDQPIVIGKLYLGAIEEARVPRGTINCEELNVNTKASLPLTTKLVFKGDSSTNTNIDGGLSTYKTIADIIEALQKTEQKFNENSIDLDSQIAKIETVYAQIDSKDIVEAQKITNWSIIVPDWKENYFIWQKTTCYNKRGQIIGEPEFICLSSLATTSSYWLKCSTRSHTGTQQKESIQITAMIKLGSATETEDTSAVLKYKWQSDTDWTVLTNTENIVTYKFEIASDTCKDENLLIKAYHGETEYESETIMFAPLNTPILVLTNYTDSLAYDSDGTDKLNLNDKVTTTAKLLLNNKEVTGVTYNWKLSDCKAEGTESSEITGSELSISSITSDYDYTNEETGVTERILINSGTAVCTVDYQGLILTATFTVNKNRAGQAGDNGISPTIGENGNWWIGEADTGIKAEGITPTININEDGYWVINGEPTDIKAKGEAGHTPEITIGDNGNWVIDGVDSGIKAKGEDGSTPEITIGENGNWYINGKDSGVKAKGEDGQNGNSIDVQYAFCWTNNYLTTPTTGGLPASFEEPSRDSLPPTYWSELKPDWWSDAWTLLNQGNFPKADFMNTWNPTWCLIFVSNRTITKNGSKIISCASWSKPEVFLVRDENAYNILTTANGLFGYGQGVYYTYDPSELTAEDLDGNTAPTDITINGKTYEKGKKIEASQTEIADWIVKGNNDDKPLNLVKNRKKVIKLYINAEYIQTGMFTVGKDINEDGILLDEEIVFQAGYEENRNENGKTVLDPKVKIASFNVDKDSLYGGVGADYTNVEFKVNKPLTTTVLDENNQAYQKAVPFITLYNQNVGEDFTIQTNEETPWLTQTVDLGELNRTNGNTEATSFNWKCKEISGDPGWYEITKSTGEQSYENCWALVTTEGTSAIINNPAECIYPNYSTYKVKNTVKRYIARTAQGLEPDPAGEDNSFQVKVFGQFFKLNDINILTPLNNQLPSEISTTIYLGVNSNSDLIREITDDERYNYVIATQPFSADILKQVARDGTTWITSDQLVADLFEGSGKFNEENNLGIKIAGQATGPYTSGNIQNLSKVSYSNLPPDAIIAVFYVSRQFTHIKETVTEEKEYIKYTYDSTGNIIGSETVKENVTAGTESSLNNEDTGYCIVPYELSLALSVLEIGSNFKVTSDGTLNAHNVNIKSSLNAPDKTVLGGFSFEKNILNSTSLNINNNTVQIPTYKNLLLGESLDKGLILKHIVDNSTIQSQSTEDQNESDELSVISSTNTIELNVNPTLDLNSAKTMIKLSSKVENSSSIHSQSILFSTTPGFISEDNSINAVNPYIAVEKDPIYSYDDTTPSIITAYKDINWAVLDTEGAKDTYTITIYAHFSTTTVAKTIIIQKGKSSGTVTISATYKKGTTLKYSGISSTSSGTGSALVSVSRNYTSNDVNYNTLVQIQAKKVETTGDIYAQTFYNTSDLRLKENITSLTDTLKLDTFYANLNPVTFSFKNNNQIEHLGFIAQELASNYEQSFNKKDNYSLVTLDPNGYYNVNYSDITVLNAAQIKHLMLEIKELKQAYSELLKKVNKEDS